MKPRFRFLLAALMAIMLGPPPSRAQDICAKVKIQIEQELTFEREAFEARMTINNGLPESALTDLSISVTFADSEGKPVVASSDPDNTAALFFIRLQTGSSIPSSIASGSSGSIRWLIIPSITAGGSNPNGTLYLVGAQVSYKVAGAQEQATVAPDSIYVKPMPRLTLDYFIPSEVIGDDPFTAYIEEPEPFSLGLRLRNTGFGPAKNLKIDSSQPKIVENKQGLLVAFRINGCVVDDRPALPTLLADFGTIPGGTTRSARWLMTSSLYGRFTEFNASFSHADDLGGRLTSLIEKVSAHIMITDVLVDLPGRDLTRDFLAYADSSKTTAKVWESSGIESEVILFSSGISTSVSGDDVTVSCPGGTSPVYLKTPDPFAGRRRLASAIRADGKSLPPGNAWLSKTYLPGSQRYNYFLNVFDTGNEAGLGYSLKFETAALANRKPRMIDPGNRIFPANATFEMLLLADDPDADPLTISASSLPEGATFTKINEGVSALRWSPTAAQAGDYTVSFTVSDGLLTDRRTIVITITTDATLIAWKNRSFGPDPRPTDEFLRADDDGDDLDNALEFGLNRDPAAADDSGIILRVEPNADNDLVTTLTYLRRTDDPTLIMEVIGADSSRADAEWSVQPQALDPDQSGVPDGMQRWKGTDSIPLGGAHPRRFLKLRARISAP
jgi:hypothetical protein